MSSTSKTLTEGPLAKQIQLVSLPLMLSNLLHHPAPGCHLVRPGFLPAVLLAACEAYRMHGFYYN